MPKIEKALSIRQPWAWLIAKGYKTVENRSRPTRMNGWFAIHASTAGNGFLKTGKVTESTIRTYDEFEAIIEDAEKIEPEISKDLGERFLAKREADPHYQELHFGAIIGAVEIVGNVAPTQDFEQAALDSPDLAEWYRHQVATNSPPDAWHEPTFNGWCLRNAVMFDRPIPCKGALSFWPIPPRAVELVNEYVARAARPAGRS